MNHSKPLSVVLLQENPSADIVTSSTTHGLFIDGLFTPLHGNSPLLVISMREGRQRGGGFNRSGGTVKRLTPTWTHTDFALPPGVQHVELFAAAALWEIRVHVWSLSLSSPPCTVAAATFTNTWLPRGNFQQWGGFQDSWCVVVWKALYYF